ncbi:hypothetical protein L9F63_011667 [Diploptera punctata]|uniref:Sodium/calcium exchanger membrane region domain-containing protein n=1 Tax=Diploptera punctata TaxID=6984 RepID=A0AAD8AFS5_DIPPU|nr:hypothetical protein L9F63_011667 [Diploptera punctata]
MIKYSQLIFCYFNTTTLQYVGPVLLLLWLVCLFIILGTTSEEFFCPSLAVLASLLKLSENVAGVTVLALGNGAPDIFSSIQGVYEEETELVFSEIMGGGLFVSIVVVGTLCIKSPFRLQGGLFVRDCTCYIIAVFWSYFCLKNNIVKLWQASIFLILYILYIALVVLSEIMQQGKKSVRTTLRKEVGEALQEIPQVQSNQNMIDKGEIEGFPSKNFFKAIQNVAVQRENRKGKTNNLVKQLDNLQLKSELGKSTDKINTLRSILSNAGLKEKSSDEKRRIIGSSIRELIFEDEEEEVPGEEVERVGLIKEFLHAINPIDKEDWKEMGFFSKVITSLKAPFYTVLKLLIPVVDYTIIKNGWCKLLYIVNCIVVPLYAVIATDITLIEIMPGVPCVFIAGLISLSLSVSVALTSIQSRPPAYHSAFALMGFGSSVVTVYVVVKEVVGVLNAFGLIFSVSDATLGITLMALGNSVGDLVTTLSLAAVGLPRMAFAGCYGGPLLNVLLGLGLALTLKALINGISGKNYLVKVELGMFAGNVIMYLVAGLLTSLLMLPAMGFEARRSFGCYLILIYFLFTLNIFLVEFDVIHPLSIFYHQKGIYPNGTIANITRTVNTTVI